LQSEILLSWQHPYYKIEQIVNVKEEILNEYKKLFIEDTNFLKSIESSTAKPSSFLYRINTVNNIIKKYVGEN